MAQVSVSPSPAVMSTRRAPLSNLPNAVNSPYQMTAVTTASMKRSRSHQRDVSYGQPPPKKQAVEGLPQTRTPVRRSHHAVEPTKPVPTKRAPVRTRPAAATAAAAAATTTAVVGGPPAFAEVRKPAIARTAAETAEQQTEDVRAWQKHYRKAFPAYVFFFENIPLDISLKAQKQISTLGATYEKFFSSKVTHLITNRPPPVDAASHQSAALTARWNSRATVNPALIDQRAETRKGGTRGGTDILLKAREYGMKIWAIEKLDRVLNVLFDFPTNRPHLVAVHSRHPITQTYTHTQHNVDLSHLLRNERLHGPTDRDPSVATKDLHYWKGPYIYVHDFSGANRPIILREYPKVQRREDGTWPQFRSVSGGKCPFIEEHIHQRREKDRRAEPTNAKTPVEVKAQEKEADTTAAKLIEQRQKQVVKVANASKERPPAKLLRQPVRGRRAFAEVNDVDHCTNGRATTTTNRLSAVVADAVPKYASRPENAIAFTATNESTSQTARRSNVEPAASGVQPSNITSAIRSQMISSHHDQPGQRAGTSKEIHALHRKVAGNVLLGNQNSRPASMARRSTDILLRAAENEAKAARKRDVDGREKLVKVEEEVSQRLGGSQVVNRKPKAEPKPGYCENCREKFDDFEEHTLSRQHRKFATNNKNWAELDDLLGQLVRPSRGSKRSL